jgi:hypothetical protein
MAGWNAGDHPRDSEGKFTSGAGTRGTQRKLGQRVRRAAKGLALAALPKIDRANANGQYNRAVGAGGPRDSRFRRNGGWGIYRNEAEFDAAARRYERGAMTPAERREHERQLEAYRRA